MKDIEINYTKDMLELSEMLISYLQNCNVEISKLEKNTSFYNLIKKLDKVVAIKKDKIYKGVELDDAGYIINAININGIIEDNNVPTDIARGYYKYNKGHFILDERMKDKLWG